ncbi:MAG: flagellar motor switch protein FliN [Clostridium sp. SCN 57-10]|nr:MAG: flagellar motor switch protein FliN [Clostridium sp. SCN 57-10]
MERDKTLSAEEQDTIGEIMNISMGAAATAVSTMLEKQVTITTPRLEMGQLKDIDCADLEPAIIVKINYIQGIQGSNVIVLRRHDMRIILDLLMGNEYSTDPEDFEFDEMSMSAACEVMNQMMGASSTALSEILNIPINISIPEAHLAENLEQTQGIFSGIRGDDQVISIAFKMMIKGVLDTTFRCFMAVPLAQEIVNAVNPPEEPEPEQETVPQYTAPMQQPAYAPEPVPQYTPPTPQPTYAPEPVPQYTPPTPQPAYAPEPVPQFIPPTAPQASYTSDLTPQYAPPQYAVPPQYAQTPPLQQYYAPQPPFAQDNAYLGAPRIPDQRYQSPPVAVKSAEFPDFSRPLMPEAPYNSNLGLLMGVQLEVSVVIGRTKRKIKDIMDFGQGSVIMLDTQTGAPAEIMVNGQLIAYGDVVVVGDNFGVRITEIVGTKDLMAALNAHS